MPKGLFDLTDPRLTGYRGERVRVIQPYGCPKNGTMGHCYVEHASTKEFIGLVLVSSLVKAGDMAQEHEEHRSTVAGCPFCAIYAETVKEGQ